MDPFAVAVMKSREIVGNVPQSLSCVCSMFLRRGSSMACRITGGRQHSKDLPQGGLEVPCIYVFTGPSDIVDKTQQRLAELKIQAVKQTSAELKPESDAGDTDAKVKNDVVDLDGLQVSAEVTDLEIEIHSGAWIAVQDITLTEDDKQSLMVKCCKINTLTVPKDCSISSLLLYMDFSRHSYKTSQSKDLLGMPYKSFMSGKPLGCGSISKRKSNQKSMILFMLLWTRHQLQQ